MTLPMNPEEVEGQGEGVVYSRPKGPVMDRTLGKEVCFGLGGR